MVCRGGGWGRRIIMRATVTLSDYFSFKTYEKYGTKNLLQPTAVGYRLETSGFIRGFRTRASWGLEVGYDYEL